MSTFNFIHLQEVSSTMDVIKQYENNTVLLADSQTAGRGKGNRSWESPKSNNIYLSFKIKDIGEYSYCYVFMMSLIVLNSIKYFYSNINLKLKWPNDVLLDNKKIAGTLIERDLTKKELITGTGINIDFSPKNTLFTATNLKKEGFSINKMDLVQQMIIEMEKYMNNNINFDIIIKEWLKYGYNLGQIITIKSSKSIKERNSTTLNGKYKIIDDSLEKNLEIKNQNETITGIFETIDKNGNLILNINNRKEKIFVGDVF